MTLHVRQTELEEEMVSLGRARYARMLETQGVAASRPGSAVIATAVAGMTQVISDSMEAYASGTSGRYATTVLALLTGADTDAVSYVALRRAIQGASCAGMGEVFTRTAHGIGVLIEEHIAFETFRKQERRLSHWWEERAKQTTNSEHARKVMRAGVRRGSAGEFDWTREDHIKLGSWLIEIMEDRGLIVRVMQAVREKTQYKVTLAPALLEYLTGAHEACALSAPFLLPMVMRPIDWTTPFAGGYLHRRAPLVTGHISRSHLDDLASADLSRVYASVNTIQSTAWAVNTPVLSVMEILKDAPAGAPGLPGTSPMPLPPRPAGIPADVAISDLPEEQQKELALFRRASKEVYDQRAADRSRRVSFSTTLYVARRFKDEPEIFFPHQLDSRGRIYSIPSGLSPQGDDLTKSLLRFASGQKLGEDGAYWLSVHVANCFGVDKVTFDERVAWCEANYARIMQTALSPLDDVSVWSQADKPWQFLAACMEWAGMQLSGNHEEFVSYLPIGMDGSCSGLQHFSAALKDPVGGRAVNLVPTGKVEDIYTEVANRVNACLNDSTCADDLIVWRGFVDRKIVKQPCMTYAYSSTVVGTRDMIIKVLSKRSAEECPVGDAYGLAMALAPVVRRCIEETVIAAAGAMKWLQEVSNMMTDANLAIQWTAPSGFFVRQMKSVPAITRPSIWYSGHRMQLQLSSPTDKLSKLGQKNAIAPNWIHSMDAAHLVAVVNACYQEGMESFAMIHDSFGVHAADVSLLNEIIRDTFIDQYSVNRLAEFRDQLAAQVEGLTFPALPATGSLDLEGVRASEYFFA